MLCTFFTTFLVFPTRCGPSMVLGANCCRSEEREPAHVVAQIHLGGCSQCIACGGLLSDDTPKSVGDRLCNECSMVVPPARIVFQNL